MSAVLEIVECARQHGVEMSASGDRLKLRAPVQPPDELMARIRSHKVEVVALLRQSDEDWSPEDWCAFFEERAAIFEYDSGMG